MSIHYILLLLAILCELLAAVGLPSRINLTALGLFFYFLTFAPFLK